LNDGLARQPQAAGVEPQPFPLKRRDGRQSVRAGDDFDSAGCAEAMAATHVSVIDSGGQYGIEETLSSPGNEIFIPVAKLYTIRF
jgi:hypothetical protein